MTIPCFKLHESIPGAAHKNETAAKSNASQFMIVAPATPLSEAEDAAKARGKIDSHGHASGLERAPRVG